MLNHNSHTHCNLIPLPVYNLNLSKLCYIRARLNSLFNFYLFQTDPYTQYILLIDLRMIVQSDCNVFTHTVFVPVSTSDNKVFG